MEIDEEEDHSDPPLHESDINELLEANDLQEKQDHSSVQSDGALVVHPALRLGLITNLCKYDYTSGEPLDPPPIPPPIGQFLLMSDVAAFWQEWTKHHGYTVSKAQSNANKNVYIQCNTSGEFRGQQLNPSGQQTATKKIRCPFEFKASIPTSKTIMNKTWTLEIRDPENNHKPLDSPLAHAAHKQITLEQVLTIQKLSQSKLKPAQILLQLQTSDNKTYATNKTISNVLQKQRLKGLHGRTPIQALLDIFKETNWTYNVKLGSDLSSYATNASDLSSYATNASNAHPGTRISPELPARLVPYVPTFIEFGHAYLKRFIVNSTGNLLSVFKLLALVFDIQINHVHESICRDTVKTLVNVHKLFVPLLGKILTFASKECLCQFKRLEDLDLKDSHLQWHLRYNPEFRKTEEEEINLDKELKMITISLTHKQPTTVADLLAQMKGIAAGTHKAVTIQAPQVKKQTKGRPSTKAEQLTTTKRKPLAFEVVEANLKHYRSALNAQKAKQSKQSKPMNKNEPTKRHKTDLEDEYSPESDFNGIDFSLLEACGAEEPNSEASNEEVEEVETKEESEPKKQANKPSEE
ncbi:hypothetical protein MJO29_006175 [Puccinia striiformis f. sp. tritici]|nr:hypothetical protein MJO29_006175 [Puccinia striiformis f. sp. tritici]